MGLYSVDVDDEAVLRGKVKMSWLLILFKFTHIITRLVTGD